MEENTNSIQEQADASKIPDQKPSGRQNSSLLLAGSIVLAGALIASGIFLGFVYANKVANKVSGNAEGSVTVSPFTDDDHVYGSPDAKLKLLEFSDLDCPFCKTIHVTLKRLVDESDGKIAWVFRNFPLTERHPSAGNKAMVAECISDIAGNDTYWQFLNAYFSQQDASASVDLAMNIAELLGVNRQELQNCYEEGRFEDRITSHIQDAVTAGANGTPYTVVVTKNKNIPIGGAQPIENFKKIIDPLLK